MHTPTTARLEHFIAIKEKTSAETRPSLHALCTLWPYCHTTPCVHMFQGHARASCHFANSARFRPVAVMNPCMCGRLSDPGGACSKVPRCAADFQARVAVARAEGQLLEEVAKPDAEGWALHTHAAECLKLSARGWHRVQQVARDRRQRPRRSDPCHRGPGLSSHRLLAVTSAV